MLAQSSSLARAPVDAFVFPGAKTGRPLSGMAMEMLLRRMDAAYTVHGFRSSFKTWATEATSFPNELSEAALAHVTGDQVERAYRRTDVLERRRELMEAWALFLDGTEMRITNYFSGSQVRILHHPPRNSKS